MQQETGLYQGTSVACIVIIIELPIVKSINMAK